MAPRKRSDANAWMKDYPGLHVFPDGRFYVIHPTTARKASLKTRDKMTALKLYALLSAKWQPEKVNAVSNSVLMKLNNLEIPRSVGDDINFRDYAQKWRENVLGFKVDAAGAVTLLPTKVTKPNGKAIEPRTQRDYGRQCRQLELSEESTFPLSDKQLLRKTRKLMAAWADKPTHYNHLLAVISHIYRFAIIEGIISANPAREIDPMGTAKREVYINDADYVAITAAMIKHQHHGQVRDGEWRARICDLLYMLSSRPVDVFKIEEKKNLRLDLGEFGEIHFGHGKTKVDQIIAMNADMREVVDWFIAYKRRNRIFNQALLCYPPYMGTNAGQTVTHRAMQKYWAEAVVDAGFAKGQYQLRDLRKKGLTDEFVSQGENDKGGHLTQGMADYYRLIKPPKRAQNTLVDLRKAGSK